MPGTRNRSVTKPERIAKLKPQKLLIRYKHTKRGRNHRGIITSRNRGGGHKRLYRMIDFRRNKEDIFGEIKTIEYDPNRNTCICLTNYRDGDKRYVLHSHGIGIGDNIITGTEAPISIGNTLPLSAV
jgi:large subunit ribosomal protein L2